MANEAWLVSATRPNEALKTTGYFPHPPVGQMQPSGMFVDLMNAPHFAQGIPEWAARVCYNSQHRFLTDGTYLLDRTREEHLDVLEHTVFTINCSSAAAILPDKFSVRSGHIYGNDTVTANMRVWWEAHRSNRLSNVVSRILAEQAPALFKMTGREREGIRSQVPPAANSRIYVPEARWEGYHVALLGANLFEDEIAEQVQHCSASFYLGGGSRAMTHQLVRHRLKSFCLAGDTVVPSFSDRVGPGKMWTIRQLWEWSQDSKRKGRLKLIRLRGVDQEGLLIRVGIKSIVASGQQQLYRVRTESGRSIRATAKHRFMTPSGWKRLEELAVDDLITANGVLAYQDREYVKKKYLDENMERKVLAAELGVADSTLGKWISKWGLQKPKSAYPNRQPGRGKKGMFTEEALQRLSESKRGDSNPSWKGEEVSVSGGRVRANRMYEAIQCERCPDTHRVQRHHVDGDPTNNAPENIRILCELCHKAEHYGQQVRKVFSDRIVSIEKDVIEDTYDLEINHACHNFVADGFVVHNSQESQRYTDFTKLGGEVMVPPSIAGNPEALALYDETMQMLAENYAKLRRMKIRKEDARYILPNAATTKIVVTAQFDSWLHFLWLRAADKAAQWEIREFAYQMGVMLETIAPSVFGAVMDKAREVREDMQSRGENV